MIRRSYHGLIGTREYNSWRGMIERCENPKHRQYRDYGGRGVTVCRRWRNSFPAFLEDMGTCPAGKTLDRLNNKKDYGPKNCAWRTRREQGRNKRNNRILTAFGETMTLAAWCERTGLNYVTITKRIDKHGWTVEEALSVSAVQAGRPKRKGKGKGQEPAD